MIERIVVHSCLALRERIAEGRAVPVVARLLTLLLVHWKHFTS